MSGINTTLDQQLNELKQQQWDALMDIYSKPMEISKSIDTSNALYGYNLSDKVTELETYFSPHNIFRNKLPRVSPQGGITGIRAEWKQVTSVYSGQSSASEGGSSSYNTTTSGLVQKDYKTQAIRDFVTREAIASGNGFVDNFGSSVIRALRTFHRSEEFKIFGGNSSTVINAPSAFSLQASNGGSIASGTYGIKVCSMSAEVLQKFSNPLTGANLSINRNVGKLTLRPTLDINGDAVSGSYWGVGVPSANDNVSVSTNAGTITVTITPVENAFAYAIFAKTGSDDYTLQMITTYSTATLTNYYTTGSVIGSVNGSADSRSYDGLMPTIVAANASTGIGGDNAYAQLTACGTGCVEINDDLQGIFNTYGVDITDLYVSGDLRDTITQAVIASGGFRNIVESSQLADVVAGRQIGVYIHPSTGEKIKVWTHRYIPEGSYMGLAEQVPFPEVGNAPLIEVHVAQDYFQWDVPATQRRKEFEIFNYAVLGHRAPQWAFVRKNIKKGLAS